MAKAVRTSKAMETPNDEDPAPLFHESLASVPKTSKIADLLEKGRALVGAAGGKATPGVKKTLEEMIKQIDEDILAVIKEHHHATQEDINKASAGLATKTRIAEVALHEARQSADEHTACTGEQGPLCDAHQECETNLKVEEDHEAKDCKVDYVYKRFTGSLTLQSEDGETYPTKNLDSSIEFKNYGALEGDKAYEDWKEGITKWLDDIIKPSVLAKFNRYHGKKEECTGEFHRVEGDREVCLQKKEACDEKTLSCTEHKSHSDIHKCVFGDRLQEKCEAKAEFQQLVDDTAMENNTHSEVDRAKEWEAAEMIKCILGQMASGSDLNLGACQQNVSYVDNVGTLDLKKNMLELEFTCAESTFAIGGVDETVTLTMGEPAFEKCSSGGSVCSETFVCTAPMLLKAGAPCFSAEGCTEVDCCTREKVREVFEAEEALRAAMTSADPAVLEKALADVAGIEGVDTDLVNQASQNMEKLRQEAEAWVLGSGGNCKSVCEAKGKTCNMSPLHSLTRETCLQHSKDTLGDEKWTKVLECQNAFSSSRHDILTSGKAFAGWDDHWKSTRRTSNCFFESRGREGDRYCPHPGVPYNLWFHQNPYKDSAETELRCDGGAPGHPFLCYCE